MARFLSVTPNPAVDVTYRVDHQVIGETVRVREMHRQPGGKGVNVARVLHALGRPVSTAQPLGGATGAWLAERLTAEGLGVHECRVAEPTRTTVAVVDDVQHPTLFAEPGPPLGSAGWDALGLAVSAATGAGDWVVIAGSFPLEAESHDLVGLIRIARDRGAHVLVDTSGAFLVAAADAGADVVKANELEVRDAVGEVDLDRALSILGARGSTVVVSRGSAGAVLRSPDGEVHTCRAVPDVEGNPTGAGDAATAGLVAAFSEGRDADTALAWAATCGAAAVLSPTAGRIDVRLLSELWARLGANASPLQVTGAPVSAHAEPSATNDPFTTRSAP